MTSARFCPIHGCTFEDYCDYGHEPDTWWVVDTEAGMLDNNWRIAVVEGFRVRWQDWFEDLYPALEGRTPQGMTAAAATRANKAERAAHKRRSQAERDSRYRSRKHGSIENEISLEQSVELPPPSHA